MLDPTLVSCERRTIAIKVSRHIIVDVSCQDSVIFRESAEGAQTAIQAREPFLASSGFHRIAHPLYYV